MANIPLGGKEGSFFQHHNSRKHRSPLTRDGPILTAASEFSFKPSSTSALFGAPPHEQSAHATTREKDKAPFSFNTPNTIFGAFPSSDSHNAPSPSQFKERALKNVRRGRLTATQSFLSNLNIKPGNIRTRFRGARAHPDQKMQSTMPIEENSTRADNMQDTKKDKWMASPEEVAHLTSVLLKGLHPNVNNRKTIHPLYSRFGHIKRLNCNRVKNYAIIRFSEHEEAKAAKEEGKDLLPNHPPISIFWSKSVIPPDRLGSEKSSPRKVEVQEKAKDHTVEPSLQGEKNLTTKTPPSRKKAALPFGGEKTQSIAETVYDETSGTENKDLEALVSSPATSISEKFQILNARDNLLRQKNARQASSYTDSIIVGTCPDMCPEKERYSRIDKNFLSIFEKKNGVADQKALVKKYSRSSADQKEPLPHDLRPVPVLEMTMDYLLCNIVDCTSFAPGEWFDFIWDRTRAIRKDITIQHPCDLVSVGLIEKCARFHIYCGFAMCTEDLAVFDPKINNDNIAECLQTLRQLYHDLAIKGISCPNELEFRCYDVLFNLTEGGVLRKIQDFPAHVQSSSEVKFSIQLLQCLMSNNYVRFFRLVRGTAFLNACLLHRYFSQIRFKALRTMIKAYSHSNNPEQIPLSQLVSVLAFEDVEHARSFCNFLELPTKDDFVTLVKVSFNSKETLPTYLLGSHLVESKQNALLGEIINGGPLPSDPYPTYQPHSSFDENGRLKPEALNASDQQSLADITDSPVSATTVLVTPSTFNTTSSFSQKDVSMPPSNSQGATNAFFFAPSSSLGQKNNLFSSSAPQDAAGAFTMPTASANSPSPFMQTDFSNSSLMRHSGASNFTFAASSMNTPFSFKQKDFSFAPSTSHAAANPFALTSASVNASTFPTGNAFNSKVPSSLFQLTTPQQTTPPSFPTSTDVGLSFHKQPEAAIPFTFKVPSTEKASFPRPPPTISSTPASFSFIPKPPSSLRTSSPFFAPQDAQQTNEQIDKLTSTFYNEILGEVVQDQIAACSREMMQNTLAQEIWEALLQEILWETCLDLFLDEQRGAIVFRYQCTIDVCSLITNEVMEELVLDSVRNIWVDEKVSSLLEGLIGEVCHDIISEVVESAKEDQKQRKVARHLKHVNFIAHKYFERWQQKVKRRKKLEFLLKTFPPGPGFGSLTLNHSGSCIESLPVESLFSIQKQRKTTNLLLDAGLQIHFCRERYAANPIPMEKLVPQNSLFKLLVLVPSSLASSPLKVWLCNKLTGKIAQKFDASSSQVEQLSLFKTSKNAYISTSCVSGLPHLEQLTGASAIIVFSQDSTYLWKVKTIASNLNPLPAICLMTIEEAKINVPSEIRRFQLVNQPYEDSVELMKAVKWLQSNMQPPPSLKGVPFKDYMLDGLCHHVFTRMSQCYAAAPSLEVDTLLSFYAAGLNHLLSVLTSPRIQSLTWPPQEFHALLSDEEKNFTYPKKEWNSQNNLFSIFCQLKKLQLPTLWDNKEDVSGFLDLLLVQLGWSRSMEPYILSERINLLLDKSNVWSTQIVPWPEILSECVYEMIDSLDWIDEDGHPIVVYYFEDEYQNFEAPSEWIESIWEASKLPISHIQGSPMPPSLKKLRDGKEAGCQEASEIVPPPKVRRLTALDLSPSSICMESQLCLQQEEEIAREKKASQDFLAILEKLRDEGEHFPIIPKRPTKLFYHNVPV